MIWDFGWEGWRCRRCIEPATHVNHFRFDDRGAWAEKALCEACVKIEQRWDANVNERRLATSHRILTSYYLPILVVLPHGDLHLQLELAFHTLCGMLDHTIDNRRDDDAALMSRVRRELAECAWDLDWARRVAEDAF